MRAAFLFAHRYLALGLGLFWLLQALSGIVLVFHRPIDDQLLGASGRPVSLAVVDAAIVDLKRLTQGTRVLEYFPSGGVSGQLDILVDRGGGVRDVVRIDGATGEVLRISAWEGPVSGLSVFRIVLLFHKQLLASQAGHWIIGVSGAVLFINILLGLRLAWPARGRWRAILVPRGTKSTAAALFAWHRALGLWLAPFGLLIAATGSLMVWSPNLQKLLVPETAPPVPHALSPGQAVIPPSAAVAAALARFGDGAPAVVTLPNFQRSWYSVQLRRPGELRRVFGTTRVLVDATTGQLLQATDAVSAPVAARVLAGLWPVHSGEWAGVITRLLTLTTGVWLAITVGLGLMLWWKRRRMRQARTESQSNRHRTPA